jgi:hypothetical protein
MNFSELNLRIITIHLCLSFKYKEYERNFEINRSERDVNALKLFMAGENFEIYLSPIANNAIKLSITVG